MAEPVRAGIYTRISLAVLGDNTKVDDQERICRALAGQLGWEVTDVYCDHSKSAWQKNRKRPAWNRMLADVDSGRINAIIVYHGDRLVRRPEDLADLIRLADSKGVKLANPTGMYDLDKSRLEPWIRAAFAEEESQRTSERRKDQYRRWRAEGRVRPGGRGGRPYGFETDGITHIPAETTVIREMAERVLAGEPTGAIARGVSARGARTPTGAPFSHATVRKMLARPRLAGLMPDGENKGAWEPVLDRETWEQVRRLLDTKASRHTHATNARRWLLSGIAVCGACGQPLAIKTENRPGKVNGYRCVTPGCRRVQRSQPVLDEYIITRTLTRLSDPRNPPGRVPRRGAGEWKALAAERARVEQMLGDHTQGRADLLMKRLGSIDARLAQLRELAAGDASARLLGKHTGLTRERWDTLPLATRRALIAACFTVTVLPASKRGPGFRTGDVRLTSP